MATQVGKAICVCLMNSSFFMLMACGAAVPTVENKRGDKNAALAFASELSLHSFLAADDLKAKGNWEWDQKMLVDQLGQSPEFYSESGAPTDLPDGCVSNAKIEATKSELQFSSGQQDLSCSAGSGFGEDLSVRTWAYISCNNDDLGHYHGKAALLVDSTEFPNLCPNSTRIHYAVHMQIALPGRRMVVAQQRGSDSPCLVERSGGKLQRSCESTGILTKTGSDSGQAFPHIANYKFSIQGAEWSSGQNLYSKGDVEFKINNWQGRAKYSDGQSADITATAGDQDLRYRIEVNEL